MVKTIVNPARRRRARRPMNDLLSLLVLGIAAGAPLAAALLTPVVGRFAPQWPAHGPACVGALVSLAAAVAACALLLGASALPEQPLMVDRWLPLGAGAGISLGAQMDSLSAMFLLASSLAAYVVLCDPAMQAAGPRPLLCASLLQGASVLMLLAGDWLTLFCCWQLSALAALLLEGSSGKSAVIDPSALRRYITGRIADVPLLYGLLLMGKATGSFGLATPIAGASGVAAAPAGVGLCVFAAVAARAGLFPLRGPTSTADGSVASGALLEAAWFAPLGLYVAARALPLVMVDGTAPPLVALVAALTSLGAGVTAAAQADSQRRLAWCASSLFGLVVLGLATGTPTGIAAALALAAAFMPAAAGLWLARPAWPGGRLLFLVCACLLGSGYLGQHALLGAAADLADQTGRGILWTIAYWCGMASLPCLAFALTRGWMSFPRISDNFALLDSEPWQVWLLLPAAAVGVPLLVYGQPGSSTCCAQSPGKGLRSGRRCCLSTWVCRWCWRESSPPG
jgi:NADH:ubiquinone oxidoreductase subunit 2 (subunit N)